MATTKKTYSKQEKEELRRDLFQIGSESVARNIFYSIKSRYKILYIVSSEEERIIRFFQKFCVSEIYTGFVWDCSRGLIDIHSDQPITTSQEEITDPEAMLSYLVDLTKQETNESSNGRIFLLLDFHRFLEDADATIERKLKEFAHYAQIDTVVIVAPEYICSTTLDKEVTMIDFPYPSKHEVEKTLENVRERVVTTQPKMAEITKKQREEIIHAVSGLTLNETKNALAKTVVQDHRFKIETLLKEKESIVKKSGLLEICHTDITMEDVGGLNILKDWLALRQNAFYDDAREFGLPEPRGILLVGTPGCVLGNTKIRIKKISNKGKHEIFCEFNGEKALLTKSIRSTNNKRNMQTGQEKELTIEEFFKLCQEESGTYQIDTPDGWKDINFLIKKKNKECYNTILEGGSIEISCSSDHYLLTDNGWKKTENVDVQNDAVYTRDGIKQIVAKEYIGVKDTFDLEIDSKEHRYYSNDIISHNSGKSFSAKAVAQLYNVPLLRLDMGAMFASRVGESESRIRNALKIVDIINSCVLWLEEIEKGISGTASSAQTDGGTTARVVSTLLTWMQEKRNLVFIIATANSIANIPPEFMRAGRFDEVFFLDLPGQEERADIAGKLLRRRARKPQDFDLLEIARSSDAYVGAEIEKAIDNALFLCYSEDKRKLKTEDICSAFKQFIPLSQSRREEIDVMRKWAKDGGAIIANSSIVSRSKKTRKKKQIEAPLDFDMD